MSTSPSPRRRRKNPFPEGGNPHGPVVNAPQPAARPPLPIWRLRLEAAVPVTPRMRRLRFSANGLEAMRWSPGQDLVLDLPDAPRRHYTIRAWRPTSLDIDFVLHGHGAAAAWAVTAQPGDEIEARGPRGRTRLAEGVDWHLFVGDETCLPAIAAMLEALPAGAAAHAIVEIEDDGERQPVRTQARLDLAWVVRGGPARPNDLLLNALKEFERPPGVGHAYVIGETSGVRAERHFLLERGWDPQRITAEGYWRPGRIGGHDHV